MTTENLLWRKVIAVCPREDDDTIMDLELECGHSRTVLPDNDREYPDRLVCLDCQNQAKQ
jgi:hypothetical protein